MSHGTAACVFLLFRGTSASTRDSLGPVAHPVMYFFLGCVPVEVNELQYHMDFVCSDLFLPISKYRYPIATKPGHDLNDTTREQLSPVEPYRDS